MRSRYTRFLTSNWLLAASLLLISCAGSRSFDRASPLVDGEWAVEIATNDIGTARTVMTFEEDAMRFEAHTREGAASELVGWFDLVLAKTFAGLFERGALAHLTDGEIVRGESGVHSLRAILDSPLGRLRFEGALRGDSISGTLSRRGETLGRLVALRGKPAMPLRDYTALNARLMKLIEERIYSSAIPASEEWREFRERMEEGAATAQDDLDYLFRFYHFGENLPFSHLGLYRPVPDAMTWTSSQSAERPLLALKDLSPRTGLMTIGSFAGESRPIDSLFEIVSRKGYANLVIDLRGNLGGNISAMRVAAHLVDEPRRGGTFVTRRWFERHSAPPTPEEIDAFPVLEEANLELLFKGIHEEEGMSLRIVPAAPRYTGRVYVLVDGSTASACEPLVYGIKQYGLGTIIGERTAGAMLSGETFDLGDGWSAIVPTAEYYASDGFRIDRVGVAPDIEVDGEDALTEALRRIGER